LARTSCQGSIVLTTRPDAIPFDDLPDRFVVKPTHASGWVQLVTNKATLERAALIALCEDWLKRSYYEEQWEQVYKHVEPRIIVEEFIDDGSGAALNDYKLFVFDGTVEMIQVDVGRFTDGGSTHQLGKNSMFVMGMTMSAATCHGPAISRR
jgi:hypothetical protein